MGIVNWFRGVHFSWRITPSAVNAHLNQSGFASKLVESFHLPNCNQSPTATPHRSGIPINTVAPSSEDDNSPALTRRKEPLNTNKLIYWIKFLLRYSFWISDAFLLF
jgi:hypothetical protein